MADFVSREFRRPVGRFASYICRTPLKEIDMKRQQTQPQQSRQQPQADLSQVQGEGDYEAGRHYDEKTREFVKSGKVDDAARNAHPKSPREQQEMDKAEEVGKSRSKGEDPHG
jgi:hypothetical protein